jgi:hypothetical protein
LLLHHEINNILYKIFFIVPLNYLQNFLRAQQHQVKYNQEQS